MKRLLCLALVNLCIFTTLRAQTPSATPAAVDPVQVSPELRPNHTSQTRRPLKIPAGTPVEIEVAYTVSSLDVRPNDLISFRMVVPVRVDGRTVIEKNALVTGRVAQAKRGGHWGKAGKLSWTMQDVVAIDLTRVPLQAQLEGPESKNKVTGTSRSGQVATEIIVFGSLMWIAAPLALMSGFRRGDNAVLPEGKRFIVYVQKDTSISAPPTAPDARAAEPVQP
jgi:hypothetical protein